MKNIFLRAFAIAFLTAGTLAGCSSENTTGVENEGAVESQPNMGGKTGNTAGLDSIATEGNDTTTNQDIQNQ